MVRWLLGLMLLTGLAGPATAEESVVLGLSRNAVEITTNFEGSEILIFGAIRRETPLPDGPPLEVIVTVEGPSAPLTVYRKARVLGVWANTASVEVDAAPSFYAVATSAPFHEAISDTEDLRHRVSIPNAIRSVGAPMTIDDSQSFTDALIRIRKENGTYQRRENTVEVTEQTLFRTTIGLPANLTEGGYRTRILATRGGRVVAAGETTLQVGKVGLERWLYNLSRQQPLVYGVMSLAIAIAAGWGAAAAFRYLKSS